MADVPEILNAIYDSVNKSLKISGGTAAPVAGFTPATSWHTARCTGPLTTFANTGGNGYITAVPFCVFTSRTFDTIGLEVTGASGAGGTIRLGIWNLNAAGVPTSLVADAGTIDATSATFQTKTISQVLAAGWYALGQVPQGSSDTSTVRAQHVIHQGYTVINSAGLTANAVEVFQTNAGGNTGALPDPFPTALNTSAVNPGPRILIHSA